MKIDVRNDLRQTHIITNDSIVKIDHKTLAMNALDWFISRQKDAGVIHTVMPEDKQLIQRLARKIVI